MPRSHPRLLKACLALLLILALLAPGIIPSAIAQPLAEDSGIDALQQALRKLRTTARLLHLTAHPDDEDGGMLAYESRGRGADVMLLSLTRGEGGQNKTGSELFDELGILRTLELLKAGEYYGADVRFGHVVDFGFSKTSEETFQKWQGHDIALSDMVRVIRAYRPDILVSRFQGAPRDGHGNHQAAGILSREAFKAAADPSRFPEQIREGLLPWQPKKLYMDNVRANEDYTLRLDTGAYDPAVGESYMQFALEGLAHQLSQGVGGLRVPPGHHYTYYKLLESSISIPGATGTTAAAGAKEQDFFDGIDVTLRGLAKRLGDEKTKVPFLAPALTAIERNVNDAFAALDPHDPSKAAAPLLAGVQSVSQLIPQIEKSGLSPPAKTALLIVLRLKRQQFEAAANLALGIALKVAVDPPPAPPSPFFFRMEQTFQMAVPGQTFTLTARLYNRGTQVIEPKDIALDSPPGWKSEIINRELKPLQKDDNASVQFRVTVPADAPYTKPYWHRNDEQTAIYILDQPQDFGLPWPPFPVHAHAIYQTGQGTGEAHAAVQVKYIDPVYGQQERPLVVGPALSVTTSTRAEVIATGATKPAEVRIGVRNNVTGAVQATLRLQASAGWKVEPASRPLSFTHDGEYDSFRFQVTPPAGIKEGYYQLKATAEYNGQQYDQGYNVIGRHDLGSYYYYRPSVQRVSAVDVKLPKNLRVGYIAGAGDDILPVLKQLGLDADVVSAAQLASGDLGHFDTIIVGIRAYDVRTDVRENNQRLLDFVANGGTLIVQYNQNATEFNKGNYTPYPAKIANERVTLEEAPIEILAPQDPIFHTPNEITSRDFQAWIQERGLYFANQWDNRFQPLLASNDPGEQPMKGGLLVARYGKGVYIYNAYAFFRQLPAGVPGAVRLYVNLLSAGQRSAENRTN